MKSRSYIFISFKKTLSLICLIFSYLVKDVIAGFTLSVFNGKKGSIIYFQYGETPSRLNSSSDPIEYLGAVTILSQNSIVYFKFVDYQDPHKSYKVQKNVVALKSSQASILGLASQSNTDGSLSDVLINISDNSNSYQYIYFLNVATSAINSTVSYQTSPFSTPPTIFKFQNPPIDFAVYKRSYSSYGQILATYCLSSKESCRGGTHILQMDTGQGVYFLFGGDGSSAYPYELRFYTVFPYSESHSERHCDALCIIASIVIFLIIPICCCICCCYIYRWVRNICCPHYSDSHLITRHMERIHQMPVVEARLGNSPATGGVSCTDGMIVLPPSSVVKVGGAVGGDLPILASAYAVGEGPEYRQVSSSNANVQSFDYDVEASRGSRS